MEVDDRRFARDGTVGRQDLVDFAVPHQHDSLRPHLAFAIDQSAQANRGDGIGSRQIGAKRKKEQPESNPGSHKTSACDFWQLLVNIAVHSGLNGLYRSGWHICRALITKSFTLTSRSMTDMAMFRQLT